MRRAIRIWGAAAAFALCALALALVTGSGRLTPGLFWQAVSEPPGTIASQIVWELRLPRALAAFAAGGLLALAGALLQVLLRNPLADPYVLGVAGGAAFAALLAMLLGAGATLVAPAAAAGALASTVVLLLLVRRELGAASVTGVADASVRLVLAGTSLAIAWGALVTLSLVIAPERELRGMLFWLVGDLSGAVAWQWPFATLAIVAGVAQMRARDLNLLAHGAVAAQTLGVHVVRTRWSIAALASVATAAAVVTAGPVGFVGLIVPHALRVLVGNDQRVLLPSAALVGGAVLVAADTAARALLAPMQLPAGAVMALAGVPVFLWLLLGRGAER